MEVVKNAPFIFDIMGIVPSESISGRFACIVACMPDEKSFLMVQNQSVVTPPLLSIQKLQQQGINVMTTQILF